MLTETVLKYYTRSGAPKKHIQITNPANHVVGEVNPFNALTDTEITELQYNDLVTQYENDMAANEIAMANARAAFFAAVEANQNSARTKLLVLGLSDDEINVLLR